MSYTGQNGYDKDRALKNMEADYRAGWQAEEEKVAIDIDYYATGFKNGYKTGAHDCKRKQEQYAWGKLLLCIIIGTFTAHLLWAIIAAYVV